MANAVAKNGNGHRRIIDQSKGIVGQVPERQLVMILISVMLGMLLAAIDQTVVGTAMPRIIADLHGLREYAWVTTSYMLASTVMVPLYGKLSDIYGRKPFYLLGMGLFLLGSALSGTSQNMTELILYRGIQGLGAGAIMPIVLSIIGDVFPPSERGKWQGLLMAVFGLASIIGPWAGGAITDHWGWRWVFYVNMPFGVLALAFCIIALPSVYTKQEHRLDYRGTIILLVAAVPMLLGFSWAGNQYGWGDWRVLTSFAVSAVGWVVFFVAESRAPEPIISPRLFRNAIFSISVATSFFVAMGMFGAVMFIPLFMQAVIGDSAQHSGVMLTPMMLGFMVSSIVGGQIMSRTGKYKLLILSSLVVAVVGMFLLSQMTVAATNGLVVRNMVVTGLGIGTLMSLFTIVVQNAFSYRLMGTVTANLQFFRSIGSTVGIAIFGSLLTGRFTYELPRQIPAQVIRVLPARALHGLNNPSVLLSPAAGRHLARLFGHLGPDGLRLAHQLMHGVRSALAMGTERVFMMGTGLLLLAFVLSWGLREIPLRKSHTPHESADSPERDFDARTKRGVLGVALGLAVQEHRFPDPVKRDLAVHVSRRLLEQFLDAAPPALSAATPRPLPPASPARALSVD